MTHSYTAHIPKALRPDPRPRCESTRWRRANELVHVERVGEPDAPVRAVFLHGAGGHAGLLRPYAELLAQRGVRCVVPDLPGYGRTIVRRRAAVRYPDWVAAATDLVLRERESHDGTLLLVGASVGGMLAYDTATRTGAADAVVATCLLDPRDPASRRVISHHPLLGDLALPLTRVVAGPLAGVSVPMRWLTNMRAISNRPELTELVLRDRLGGGNSMPLGFLRSYLEYTPPVEPEQAQVPVVLAHPAEDRWTPVEVSLPFYERLAGPKRLVMLEGAGHIPVEEPGVGQLMEAAVNAVSLEG